MSILRGVNKIDPISSSKKDRKTSTVAIELSNQKQQLMGQMKKLLKQNTTLKQENLQLKQQIMLAKIEIENLKIKIEHLSSQQETENVTASYIRWQEQTSKQIKQAKDFFPESLSTEITNSSLIKFKIIKNQQDALLNDNETSFSNRTKKWEKSLLIKRSQNKQNKEDRANLPNKYSRKEQIMQKYRSVLEDDIESTVIMSELE